MIKKITVRQRNKNRRNTRSVAILQPQAILEKSPVVVAVLSVKCPTPPPPAAIIDDDKFQLISSLVLKNI
ncbi:hypothetical protein AKJ16_DCAP21528 [Drosera capensis]